MNKHDWYIKLLDKLRKIESGEMVLSDYILEVEEKIKTKSGLTECHNCGEKVEMIVTSEICPNCKC